MSEMLLLPPAAEPLSVAEVKAFVRVTHDDDDDLIAALIAAARSHVEALTRRALLTQSWRITLDRWPADGRLRLRTGPLRLLLAAHVVDAAGVAHAIDLQGFVVDEAADLIAAPRFALPAPGRGVAGIALDVELGFGPRPADVPAPLRQALRLLVAHWYENRGIAAIGDSVAMLPAGVAALLAPYRGLSL